MELEEINSKINNIELPNFSAIQIGFFEKQNNKTTQLIDNQKDSKFIRGKHQWYDFLDGSNQSEPHHKKQNIEKIPDENT